jgi:putative transposase
LIYYILFTALDVMPLYRSPSNRLAEYDYSQAGMYFVTICIDRLVFGIDYEMFGKVVEDDVMLNDLGLFVEQQIKETEVVRPYVEIISYIVMHDHIHIVLQIHEHNIMNKPSTNIMDTPAAMSLQHDKTH